MVWVAEPLSPQEGARLAQRFVETLEEPYRQIETAARNLKARVDEMVRHGEGHDMLWELEQEYQTLSRQYLALRAIDYFGSPAGKRARAALEDVSAGLRDAVDVRQVEDEPR